MTYSRMGRPHTTIGDDAFHGGVRDGIQWFHVSIVARQTFMLAKDMPWQLDLHGWRKCWKLSGTISVQIGRSINCQSWAFLARFRSPRRSRDRIRLACLVLSLVLNHLPIWSSRTSNSYGLAQRLAALPHPTYLRRSLRRLFRGLAAQGDLILKEAPHLDAFSGYPVRTEL